MGSDKTPESEHDQWYFGKNKMLEDVRDRYLAHINAGCSNRKADRERYAVKLQKLTIAAQCIIACGARTITGWNFENNFDIKTYWPNFLYEMDKPQ